jgi:hypothetical protein
VHGAPFGCGHAPLVRGLQLGRTAIAPIMRPGSI